MSETRFKRQSNYLTFRDLWAEADACYKIKHTPFLKVLGCFSAAMSSLWSIVHLENEGAETDFKGTDWVNCNPISRLYTNALARQCDVVENIPDLWTPSDDIVKKVMLGVASHQATSATLEYLADWRIAVELQNACNLSPLSYRWFDFVRGLERKMQWMPVHSNDYMRFSRLNPVCKLYAHKCWDMTGDLREGDLFPDGGTPAGLNQSEFEENNGQNSFQKS